MHTIIFNILINELFVFEYFYDEVGLWRELRIAVRHKGRRY